MQKIAAFSQQGLGGEFRAARFEAQQQPEGAPSRSDRGGKQVAVEQAPQSITSHGPPVNLAAHHHPTAPGAGRMVSLLQGKEARLGIENTQHHGRALDPISLLVEEVKNPLPLEPVTLGQGQGEGPKRPTWPVPGAAGYG